MRRDIPGAPRGNIPGAPGGDIPGALGAVDPSRSQAGAGMLGVIALLGLLFALVQGTLFYRSKSSARFIATEKNKILAQQVAEAGIEENIADLGSRRTRPHDGMTGFPTYTGQPVGSGTYTTSLTMLSAGPEADTVELRSLGRVASQTQAVRAKLRVKRYVDTSLTPVMFVEPDTNITSQVMAVPETTVTTVVQDPDAMPALNTTAAYDACIASSDPRCNVCHVPPGNLPNRHVINLPKHGAAMRSHFDHHGCYITTDGTCDIYNPREEDHVTWHDVTVFDTTIVDNTIYDTLVVIDTLAKVQILSWK